MDYVFNGVEIMAIILAIETSCDETAAAVVERAGENKFEVRSSIVASQIDLHRKYGGVVPEVASRAHVENIQLVTAEAMSEAKVSIRELDAIAVTCTPGLIGALLVGLNYAKALAFTAGVPLIPVHHIEGHICASYVENAVKLPFISLVASGGHSAVVLSKEYDDFVLLAQTRDDAAGEAFDKVARALDIGYPGGPAIEKAAKEGNDKAYTFPQVKLDDSDDFSFSGVKTAVINTLQKAKNTGENANVADIAASFQYAVCETLSERTIGIAKKRDVNQIVLAGGVAANKLLRAMLEKKCAQNNFNFFVSSIKYCTDNAVMIAVRAFFSFDKNQFAGLDLNARASCKVGHFTPVEKPVETVEKVCDK
ncbi:MAG: tRNA (adenosine(37)-N6)-threonylcarbamoyltransferase complex transferase subunit TsaD [Clostridiales bacterium]|jgi:N6-L-threonylcarbamoyladenine synthase|nr:tRNA (adenosine(37)-N6)-threonylcarbamoyltransferase complex transferase subunit TsaD [Clostridiales bacterium]